jgi:predicted GTPase
MKLQKKSNIIIMGAAGRDFHNFNVYFRNNENYNVIAFTATQIPGIDNRRYPPELTGKKYPNGIPIYQEELLPDLIKQHNIEQVIFGYSDVPHEYVMEKASIVLACGADFRLMGSSTTMLRAKVPIVSVCAVRTGAGKSQTSRRICDILKKKGYKVVVIRHPMPYGDLRKQIIQRFANLEDLDKQNCTIEEREDYEHHIINGTVLFAGVDYEKILEVAEKEADIIVWDGGNNDLPFYKPSLHFVIVDPHRVGHELKYHPGEANLRMANVVLINKMNTAKKEDINQIIQNIKKVNSKATIIKASSIIEVDKPELIKDKRVLVIEDGPTVTHGEMAYGAGLIAAKKYGAAEIIDPRSYAKGSIQDTYKKYKHLGRILPAVGYGKNQIRELEETINNTDCDLIVIGTPIDLRPILKLNKPSVRVKYSLKELGTPNLEDVLVSYLNL